tara:strand:+ start:44 stop:292 length:249 start_codon:yes stop_codon:yes gene_type:complete
MTNQIKFNINGKEFHTSGLSVEDVEARLRHLKEGAQMLVDFYESKKTNKMDCDTANSIYRTKDKYRREVKVYSDALWHIATN